MDGQSCRWHSGAEPARCPARDGDDRWPPGRRHERQGLGPLLQQNHAILATEGEVVLFIGQKFQHLANDACSMGKSPGPIQSERDARAAFRRSLVAEVEIMQELTLNKFV
jgi:hypothetical protein